jgi:hypothetical protein
MIDIHNDESPEVSQVQSRERRRKRMIQAVRRYFDACNSADPAIFAEALTEDCLHFFPPQAGGPYRGRDAIIALWAGTVRTKGSVWSIDRLVCDGEQLVVEWTHFKPLAGEYLRGSEWYEFDDSGMIKAIWAHYASPRDPERPVNELEGFPYAEQGYPLQPPVLTDAQLASRALYAGKAAA